MQASRKFMKGQSLAFAFFYFLGIRTFQWVVRDSNNKKFRLLIHCVWGLPVTAIDLTP
jgi:hypothetical protein